MTSTLAGQFVNYWLTPVASTQQQTAEEIVKRLVGEFGIFAFGERTPGRHTVKPGDWMCFYAKNKGIVAHARVASVPEKRHVSVNWDSQKYPWVFTLTDAVLYPSEPVIINLKLRQQLTAFKDRDPTRWGWFVQAAHKITECDFRMVTQHSEYM
jgi:hypothetical protein